ncbi:response regulator [Candidatus Falkowbacteria bacterium]|nr:response regulator [Candidatus Falkowbacteria bacterium]
MPKILIVEDEEFLSDMYKIKFEQSGYAVIVAHDGLEGLKLAKKEQPDLVLLDLILPKLDGFKVLAKLKAEPAAKKIKVFILSNLGQSDEVSRGMKTGADGYFIKANLTPSQLLEKVNAIFNNQSEALKDKKSKVIHNKNFERQAVEKKQAKILLIEDEEAIINMYKLRFNKEGFEIEVAKNGAWGLKLAKQKKFDIILLDMIMPAMNGYEAIKILKSDENTKNVPIVILSNSAQDGDIEEAKKLGAAAYLLKAMITPAKLVKEVEKILNK